MLNWIGKRQLGPWENANCNASVFGSSESSRHSPFIAPEGVVLAGFIPPVTNS
jgi:hypothetical protein